MSFKITYRAGLHYLELSDVPDCIHALTPAPDILEQELTDGTWLIVAFPVWSVKARASIAAVIDYGCQHQQDVQIGLRPFDEAEEVSRWWPGGLSMPTGTTFAQLQDDDSLRSVRIGHTGGLPLWLLMHNGDVAFQAAGEFSREQIVRIVKDHVPKTS